MRIPVFLAAALIIILGGCSPARDALPVTNWSMIYNETEVIPGDVALWKPVSLPGMFRHPVTRKGEYSHAWLRGDVDITGDPERFAGIHLGRIYYIDRTFMNCVPIGSHTADEIQAVHTPRNYVIPPGTLKAGKNTVLVYLGIYGREYGGVGGSPALMPRDTFIRRTILDSFIYGQLPVGIVIFLVAQAMFNLALFYYNRNEKVNVYAAAVLICWSLYILSLFPPWFPFSIDARVTFLWSCPSSFSILYLLFIQSYYKVYLSGHNRVIIPLFLVMTAVIWSFPDTTSPYYPGRILGTAAMFTATAVLVHVLYTIKKIKKDASVTLFIIFGFLPGSLIIWDVMNYQFIYHTPPLTHTYTIPIISTLVIIYIVRDLISSKTALALLYSKLNGPDTAARGFTVTSSAEDKLKRIISFLDENYRSDISREGLAGSIGMSPDHLSRIFTSYTGKKIQDYINERRIDDARDQLKNPENRIIDIAFSVGYENLATFNRVFLKITGMTPSDFRKNPDSRQ
jgi:AraC-like DNA-binding protein